MTPEYLMWNSVADDVAPRFILLSTFTFFLYIIKFTLAVLFLFVTASAVYISHNHCDAALQVNHFNYTATGGPLNWYGLNPDANSACAKGTRQSPIVIYPRKIGSVRPGTLKLNIPRAYHAKFENLGFGLEVILHKGTLTVESKTYRLVQFHFHTPSEHRVNDEYYPMEAHFVFQSSEKKHAVVGFLFELSDFGYSFALFGHIFDLVGEIEHPGTHTYTGEMDFTELSHHLTTHRIYKYSGSLTTPPCSEDVAWYVSSEPVYLTVHDYNKVKKVLKYNARYTQNFLGEENLLEIAAHELC
ncbi:alpha carbonic anhydrase [Aspergillus ambiguus]|uniref:carbonic anhydrase family protein n=1 Tax=Aspergillus ambiguus TaxID=176160 RepID=UPI003CCD96DB